MNSRYSALTLLVLYVFAASAVPRDEPISLEGPVIAIQRGKDDTRIMDPNSMGDLAEIYMVRADHWSQPRKEKYIIVEYIHRADLISYDQFDKTRWKFELEQPSPKANKDCHTWMARSKFSFVPTTFGAKSELPNPEALPCFLTRKRPVAVSPTSTTR